MAGPEVTKKVILLGSWNEDIFSDEIVKSISGRAKTEKGKKVKVTLNEAGIKLTRSRFLQGSKSTFFPIRDLKTVTISPEVSQCVLFILSDPERKYKIIALRCASQSDMVHLINISVEIQRSRQSANLELLKRDNDNWTLREKQLHSSGRRVTDVFSDCRPNGEVPVKINGSVAHRIEPDVIPAPTRTNSYKGVFKKRPNAGSSSSHKLPRKRIDVNNVYDASDDFVIETEVIDHRGTPDQFHTRQNNDEIKKMKTRTRLTSHKNPTEGSKRQVEMAHNYVIETEILPYQHSPKLSHSRINNDDLKKVKIQARHTSQNNRSDVNRRQDDSVHSYVTKIETLPPQHSPGRLYPRQNSDEIKKIKTRAIHTSVTDHAEGNRRQDTMRPEIIPSRSVVYTTETRAPVASQPIFYRANEPSRTYEARIERSAGFLRGSWGSHGRSSTHSELIPVRVLGGNWNGRADQRSVRSNTSKISQTYKKRSFESHFQTTIPRAIEHIYPRPAVIVRPDQIVGYMPRQAAGPDQIVGYMPRQAAGHDQIVGYMPRQAAAYHVMETNEQRIYPYRGHRSNKTLLSPGGLRHTYFQTLNTFLPLL